MKKISLLVMLLLSLCVTAFAENIEDVLVCRYKEIALLDCGARQ